MLHIKPVQCVGVRGAGARACGVLISINDDRIVRLLCARAQDTHTHTHVCGFGSYNWYMLWGGAPCRQEQEREREPHVWRLCRGPEVAREVNGVGGLVARVSGELNYSECDAFSLRNALGLISSAVAAPNSAQR